MKNPAQQTTTERQIRRRSIISFSVFIAAITCGSLLFAWLYNEPETGGASAGEVQPTLRKGLETNEKVFGSFFKEQRKTKAFNAKDAAKEVRVNGDAGMDGTMDSTWRLKVARVAGDTITITLADLKALPKTQVIFDFKCVEGWSQITSWAGVRFSDFMQHYHLAGQAGMKYAGMITPDGEYYVGNDMPSMMQPQTILCYEMNGAPLPQNQGYPLRLIIPVKYGIKHLKRIGTIYFSNEKPKDYWAERGYDYFAGL